MTFVKKMSTDVVTSTHTVSSMDNKCTTNVSQLESQITSLYMYIYKQTHILDYLLLTSQYEFEFHRIRNCDMVSKLGVKIFQQVLNCMEKSNRVST